MTLNKYFALAAILLVITACGTVPQPVTVIPSTITPAIPPRATDLVTVPATIVSLGDSILIWVEKDGGCKDMLVNAYGEMILGDCGEGMTVIQPAPALLGDMMYRFAAFTYNTSNGQLVFNGKGEISGDAWQHAINRWAQMTYAESTGHVCASCRTTLVWNLGSTAEEPEFCRQLIVQNFGYAFANKIPCAGGYAVDGRSTWLETEEWAKLDNWIVNRSSITLAEGYFTGEGSQELNEKEVTEMKELAASIYGRAITK